jgi:YidC/Oxa1 family membrane protein insertase
MERRLLLAFSITIVFFIVYSHLISKITPQHTLVQEDRSETSALPAPVSSPLPPSLSPRPSKQPGNATDADLPQVEIGNYVITYSPLGGYLSKLFINGEKETLPFQNIGFSPADQNKQFTASLTSQGIEFQGPSGEKKEFIFKDYILEIKLTPAEGTSLVLFSNVLSTKTLYQRYQEIFYSRDNLIKRSAPRKMKDNTYSNVQFAGARDRYYCLSLLKGDYNLKWVSEGDKKAHLYLLSAPAQTFLYLGPQSEKELKPFGLQGVVNYGFFHAIGTGMVKLLYLFYGLTKNWGWSIVFFAVAVSLLLSPFTAKSSRAMRKMQQIQPEIEGLKQKYKDNPHKLQKETIELYRKYKINPLGGCLPLLFQIPIIMAFYQIVFRLTELKGAHFLWIKDLSSPDRFPLPFGPPLNQINLLPIFLVILGLIQQKITTSVSPTAPQHKSMGLFFAIFIGVIFYGFPAALTLYWLIQNVFTLSQQARFSRIQL